MKQLMSIAIIALALGAVATEIRPQPNIIVIYTDDHGYADLNVQEVFDDVKTPNIDALANGGVRMTSGYCTAPQCGPSRMGIISGQYQQRFGMEENGDAGTATKARFRALDTLPDRMKSAGYVTGMTGKSHIGGEEVADLTAVGFDKVFHKNRSVNGNWNMDLNGNDVAPQEETLGKSFYHLDLLADWSTAFIERYTNEPFFLYVAFRAPHVPQDAPNRYLNRFPEVVPQQHRNRRIYLILKFIG